MAEKSYIGICNGVCIVIDLNKENLIDEIQSLVKNIDAAKNEVNIYCDLMRQMFLASSCDN